MYHPLFFTIKTCADNITVILYPAYALDSVWYQLQYSSRRVHYQDQAFHLNMHNSC